MRSLARLFSSSRRAPPQAASQPRASRARAMMGGAEAEHPLLGAAFSLVAAGSAKGRVEAVGVERLLQPFGFPHVGMERPMVERVDALTLGLGIFVDGELDPRRRPGA